MELVINFIYIFQSNFWKCFWIYIKFYRMVEKYMETWKQHYVSLFSCVLRNDVQLSTYLREYLLLFIFIIFVRKVFPCEAWVQY